MQLHAVEPTPAAPGRLAPRVVAGRGVRVILVGFALAALAGLAGCGGSATSRKALIERPASIRVGTMPNLTHAPALVGRGTGRLAAAVAPTPVEWRFFNSGPSMIEALFAGELDLLYIGPSPAVNGFVRSKGDAVRIVAGVTNGGAALVARKDSGWTRPEDLAGKRIGTPGFGNTQDISVRWFARQQGLKTEEEGGTVKVMPMTNPDMIDLMKSGQIDGAWTVEPWVSRLVTETGATLLLDEAGQWPDSRYATTVLVVAPRFARAYPALLEAWRLAQASVIETMKAEPDTAMAVVNRALLEFNHKALPEALLRGAWARLQFDSALPRKAVEAGAERAQALGFLEADPVTVAPGQDLFTLPAPNTQEAPR